MNEFKNENRNRYYGKRVGDIVRDRYTPKIEGEVVKYDGLDNNRVYVKIKGRKELYPAVAEWLDIVTKVEDRMCVAKFGDSKCTEIAKTIEVVNGEIHNLCTAHARHVRKQNRLNHGY